MPKFLYDNDDTPVTPSEEGTEGEVTPVENDSNTSPAAEEFDISSFDFTIADPGEIAEFSDTAEQSLTGAPDASEKKKKEKFSFSKLSSALSKTAEKLMEEAPREPKVREKKQKPPKAQRPVPLRKEDPAKPERRFVEREKPKKERIHFTGGSFSQVSRRWLRYALRPSNLYDGVTERLWPLFLAGVMVFFGGFYLLIGLDWYFADLISMGRLWAIVGIGLLVGGTSAMAFGAGAQGLSLLCRKERISPFRVLGTVAGACVYPSSLLILGLLIQLIFRASVSMSFGITAVLWLTCILLDVLRDLFGEKNLFKSTLLIILWGFILFLIMSLTFMLK